MKTSDSFCGKYFLDILSAFWSFMKNIWIPVRVRSLQGESLTAYTSTLVKPKPFLRVLVRVVLDF